MWPRLAALRDDGKSLDGRLTVVFHNALVDGGTRALPPGHAATAYWMRWDVAAGGAGEYLNLSDSLVGMSDLDGQAVERCRTLGRAADAFFKGTIYGLQKSAYANPSAQC